MTASTSPITLPARHRIPAPTWRFHIVLAVLTWWVALVGWAMATAVHRIDFVSSRAPRRQHLAVVVAAVALVVAAAGAVVVLA